MRINRIITLALLMSYTTSCGGTDGKDGNNGLPGVNGKEGVNGKDGPAGKAGTNGIDGSPGKSAAQQLTDILQKIIPNQASILDIECFSNSTRGSGTKLSDGRVLTAFHVISGCTSVGYYSQGKLVGVGGLYSQDGTRDIARIGAVNWNTDGLALKGYVEVKGHLPAVGDLTVTGSYPADLYDDLQLSSGYVTDSSYEFLTYGWTTGMITDAATAGGSSGAPVFNKGGDLIGIHVGGWGSIGLELSIQLLLR